jgi:hybrid cluster-associated redox disulfide protein
MHITKDMTVMEVLSAYPRCEEVFRQFQMGEEEDGTRCCSCLLAETSTIEDCALSKGIDLERFLAALEAVATA